MMLHTTYAHDIRTMLCYIRRWADSVTTYHIAFTDDVSLLCGQQWADVHYNAVSAIRLTIGRYSTYDISCKLIVDLIESPEITILILQDKIKQIDQRQFGYSIRCYIAEHWRKLYG